VAEVAGGDEDGDIRASDADRDAAIDVLTRALEFGRLTPEEHGDRTEAALRAQTLGQLDQLTKDLRTPKPPGPGPARSRRQVALALGAAALILVVIVAGVTSSRARRPSSAAQEPQASQTTQATQNPYAAQMKAQLAPAQVEASPLSASSRGLQVQVIPPSEAFSSHDPADKCGGFYTGFIGGASNCYIVVRFVNSSGSSVTFTPVDLQMVDQNGGRHTVGSALPACYDTLDVNAPQTLQAGGSLDVQLCFPGVVTGTLPQSLEGTGSLSGLSLSVPSDSIDGTWGGT
jgi:hypothetical protein